MVAATTVTYGLTTPAALPRPGITVTATLCGAGDRSDTIGVAGGPVTATTGDAGGFTLSLLPNSAYRQAGTYYAVNITGGPSYNIVVPLSGVPVDLWTLRVDPRTLDPVAAETAPLYLLRAERGVALGVAALAADGRVPLAQLPAIAGGAVASVNGQLPDGDGDVTLTAADVDALTQSAGDTRYVQPATLDDYATSAELTAGLAGKASSVHTHTVGDVTGLQAALDAKATAPRFATLTKTDGNIALNAGTNTWGVLTGAPTLAVAAAAGDLIELNVQALRQTNGNVFLDFCVIVAGVPARYVATKTSTPAGEGNPALYHTSLPAAGGVWKWLAQAGDVSGGLVTVGVAIRNTSGASILLLASSDNPLQLTLENRGVPTS